MNYNTIYNNTFERSVITYPYAFWNGAFTDEELTKIINYCDEQGVEKSTILGEHQDQIDNIRRSNIKFHNYNENTNWIFDRMNIIIKNLNDQFYGFDLNGYDSFQYTTYDSKELGLYDWHIDMNISNNAPANMIETRKLSCVLLLNDEFEGGDFIINLGDQTKYETTNIKKGVVIAFPSFLPHKVMPITKGIRKSLVIWATGPKFK